MQEQDSALTAKPLYSEDSFPKPDSIRSAALADSHLLLQFGVRIPILCCTRYGHYGFTKNLGGRFSLAIVLTSLNGHVLSLDLSEYYLDFIPLNMVGASTDLPQT